MTKKRVKPSLKTQVKPAPPKLLTPEEFARAATWNADGSISCKISFDVKDLPVATTLERVLVVICDNIINITDTDDTFAQSLFERHVVEGFSLDTSAGGHGLSAENEEKELNFHVLRVADGKCELLVDVPFGRVEHWVFEVAVSHYCAVNNLDKLNVEQKAFVAQQLADYFKQIVCLQFSGYAGVIEDHMQRDADILWPVIFRVFKLPYVPAHWYKLQQKIAKNRLVAEEKRIEKEKEERLVKQKQQ